MPNSRPQAPEFRGRSANGLQQRKALTAPTQQRQMRAAPT